LKPFASTAWTRIVASELHDQLFVAVYDPVAESDMCFGREAFPALAHGSKAGLFVELM
jgi:hypothetical protein